MLAVQQIKYITTVNINANITFLYTLYAIILLTYFINFYKQTVSRYVQFSEQLLDVRSWTYFMIKLVELLKCEVLSFNLVILNTERQPVKHTYTHRTGFSTAN